MFDFIAFVKDFGIFYGLSVVCFVVLCAVIWKDMKALGREYKKAIRRIKVLEESIRHDQDQNRILCRADCIKMLRKIDEDIARLLAK